MDECCGYWEWPPVAVGDTMDGFVCTVLEADETTPIALVGAVLELNTEAGDPVWRWQAPLPLGDDPNPLSLSNGPGGEVTIVAFTADLIAGRYDYAITMTLASGAVKTWLRGGWSVGDCGGCA
jgi:hypothetical protein